MTRFRTILIDFPWPEHGGGGRGCQNHYETMSPAEGPSAIMSAPAWLPETSAHCWMWATRPFLDDAVWMLKRLGFAYKTEFVWMKWKNGKPQQSLGQYGRTVHESLLLGTRGGAMMPETPPLSVFFAAVPCHPGTQLRKHSAKPPESYDLIEQVSPGPRVEFFSRETSRPGWTTTGVDSDGQLFTAQESLPL